MNPTSLSEEELVNVRDTIDKNEEHRELYLWFKKFYKTLKQVQEEGEKSNIPYIIDLHVNQERSNYYSDFILAASSELSTHEKFETRKTFLSEEYQSVLRIIDDHENSQSHLHLVSGYVTTDDVILIEVPEQGVQIISDYGGKITIPGSDNILNSIDEWNRCRVSLPVVKVFIYKDLKDDNLTYEIVSSISNKDFMELKIADDDIQFCIKDEEFESFEKLVVRSGSDSVMLTLHDSQKLISRKLFKEDKSIIYFFK